MKKEIDYYKQFDIRIDHLKIGSKTEYLQVNHLFFEKYINEYVSNGEINIRLDIEYKERLILFHFQMKGYLTSVCDVCLEKLTLPVDKQETLMLKLVEKPQESDDENIVYITQDDIFYNVEQFIFDVLMTNIPIRKVHSNQDEDKCNENMLKMLAEMQNQQKKQELNTTWDALKKIKFEE